MIGFFKVILAIVLILLIAALTLNFMYIGGHGGIVDTLHEKMGDSGVFSFIFPAYKVRESMPVEAIEEEVLPEPTEMVVVEVTPTPAPEATVALPDFDTDSVGAAAEVVEEPAAEPAAEAAASIG